MSQSYEGAFINKLITAFQKGEVKTSFNKLKKFLENNPNNEMARYNLAIMCEQLNYIDLAVSHYTWINNNNYKNWHSRFNLYLIYIKQKKYGPALILVNEVLKINKNYQPALRDKAVILYYLKKPDEGYSFAIESINKNPLDYIAINALGLILMEMKQYNLAINKFNKAITLSPKYAPSFNNLGRCFKLINDIKNAFKNFQNALDLNSQFLEAINNIANCYNENGQYRKAISYYRKALKLNPKKSELYNNMALSYAYLRNFKKAEEFYKKSFAINPNDNLLKKNYSFMLLYQQRYQEAWKFFEGRLKLDEFKSKNNYFHNIKNKLWKGEKINKDNKILIIKEQGVGDEILYGSMYSDLLQKFQNIKIENDPRLLSLFERSFKAKNKFVKYGKYSKNQKEIKQFKTIIYAGSLGQLFRNKLSDFPKKNFLISDNNKSKILKKKIDALSSKYKIGIAWQSRNDTLGNDKPLDLNLLSPILKLNKFTFINLQYGNTTNEIKSFYQKSKIKILSIQDVDLFNDFESQAALLKNLDLFINTGNSTCHLAGALGVETWTIKPQPHFSLHYWHQPGNTIPWYPSIKLFSNEKGWKNTIQNIKKELIKKFK